LAQVQPQIPPCGEPPRTTLNTAPTMALKAFSALLLLGAAGATELTSSNWDAETAGKSVFVKFLAPW